MAPGAALHPGLLVHDVEVLRRLHDPHLGEQREVGQRLIEQVRPRREVRVEQQDEVPVGDLESVLEVAGLLVPAAVRPDGVGEPELPGQPLHLGPGAVVEHVRRELAVVGGAQRRDVCPAVAQQFDRLAVGRQEDVDGGVPQRQPAGDDLPVLGQIETAPYPVGQQRHEEGQGAKHHKRRVNQEPRRVIKQPDLAVHQRREGQHGADRQYPAVPPDVGVLLLVGRRHRKHGRRGARDTADSC